MIQFPFTIEREQIHDLPVTWVFSRQFVTNSMMITVNAGSLYESNDFLPKAEEGIFHFLEHQVFTLHSGKDVMEMMNAYASNTNALTSREKTCFYAHFVRPDVEILRILLRLVFETKDFSKDRVEKEKKIILNEMLGIMDDPLFASFELWNKLVYQNYPAWRLPIGTVRSVNQITPEKLKIAHELFYHPKQSDLIVMTNHPKSFWLPAFDILSTIVQDQEFQPKKLAIPQDPDIRSGKILRHSTIHFPIPYFMTGWKPLNQVFSYRDGIIGEMISQILFGITTKFQDALYATSLIDDSFSLDWDWDKRFGCWYMAGFSYHPEKVIDAAEKEMKRRHKIGIRKNEFALHQQYTLANNYREAYHPKEIIFQLQTLHRFGIQGWDEYYQLIQSITWEEINENLSRFMPESQFIAAILLPDSDSA